MASTNYKCGICGSRRVYIHLLECTHKVFKNGTEVEKLEIKTSFEYAECAECNNQASKDHDTGRLDWDVDLDIVDANMELELMETMEIEEEEE